MGRDKALIERDGVALARRVADALLEGGCRDVLAIGGEAGVATLGLVPVTDRWPGAGPLAALATALEAAPQGSTLVIAPCDLLDPSAATVGRLLRALEDAPQEIDVAVPRTPRGPEWIHSAWRVRTLMVAAVVAVVEGGARRLDAVEGFVQATPVDVPLSGLRDADTPEDLD